MIALLYPMQEEVGGELINTNRVKSLIIGFGPKSASFVSENLDDDVDLAVLLGTTGSLNERLSIGDIVVCDKYISSDGRRLYPNYSPVSSACHVLKNEGVKFHTGASLTVPRFGDNAETEALVINMEDFFVAEALNRKRIPLVVVRIVSDLSDERIARAQLMMRTPALSVSLRERFVIPFLKVPVGGL